MFNNSAKGYFINDSDSSINLTAVNAVFTNLKTIQILANDSQVKDGKTIKIRLIADFSKTTLNNSTMAFEVLIAGTSFLFPNFTTGAPAIGANTQTLEIDLDINFRSGNLARVLGRFSRSSNGTNLNWLTFKSAAPFTFNKTINNNIAIGARIVATANTIVIETQQFQALLF